MKNSFSFLAFSSLFISSASAFQLSIPPLNESSAVPQAKQLPQKPAPQQQVKPVLKPTLLKAIQGSGMTFFYDKLPAHEAVKISFKVHFVGPWDGTGFKEWGPDRFIAKVDNKMHLLDATFNNCHIIWSDNIWQSFPDPHQNKQLGEKGRRNFLYHGGEGAKAISSLGFKWRRSASVDSSYVFNFKVKHDSKKLDLSFLTKWVEDNSVSTYWIEDLKISTVTKLKPFNAKKEEAAWLNFFHGDGHQAQKAWANVYAANPEKLLERVAGLLSPTPKRVDFLIKQMGKGRMPTRALQKEVFIDPRRKDARQMMNRILYMRELALTQKTWSTKAGEFWGKLETNPQTRAIRKAMAAQTKDSPMLEQISLRLSGYLRMINTRESLMLANQLDCDDPDLAANPFLGDWKEEQGTFGFTIKTKGIAFSSTISSGKWTFEGDELVITWKSGNKMRVNLLAQNRCSALLTRLNPKEVKKKQFIKVSEEKK